MIHLFRLVKFELLLVKKMNRTVISERKYFQIGKIKSIAVCFQ